MQRSRRIQIPSLIGGVCPVTNNSNHICEYNMFKKEVWCVQCAELLNWNNCLTRILEDVLEYMQELQSYS
jgi:hypothetical protein